MPYYNKHNPKKPWMGQFKVNGRPTRKSFKTKKEAKAWEVKQNASKVSLTDSVSLGEWAIKYLDYSEKRHVTKTFQEEKLPAFKRLFSCKAIQKDGQVEKLTPAIALDHIQGIAKSYTGSTANTDRKNLSAAWNWGVKYLELPHLNPFQMVERQKQNKKPRYVPVIEDFWKVYDAAYCQQDKRLLLTYLHTAARKDEIFRLQWTDVDFFTRKVQLWSRKNRVGEWVGEWIPMTDELEAALKAQLRLTGKGKYVFVDSETGAPYQHRKDFMRRLCTFAGVKYFHYHAIRHLTASTLASLGVPTVDIQEILRHKLISTTDRYIRSLKQEGREAVALLPGPAEKKGSQAGSQTLSAMVKNVAK